jgi:hypothetical protein
MAPVPTAALLPLLTLLASAPGASPEIDIGDVSRAPDACPTQSQIADALEGHMPGSLARVGRELGPNVLHLGLAISPTGTARVTLTDATGGLRLERDLELPKPPPPVASAATPSSPAHEHPADCTALAETLALIVERYMRHIGYHEPPPPALVPPPEPPPPPAPPPAPRREPRAPFGLGLSVRPPWAASTRVEPEISVDVRLGRLSLAASAAYALPRVDAVPMTSGAGTFTFQSLATRVAVGWVLLLGARGSVVPAIGGGVDVIQAKTQGIGVTRHSSALEPTVEAGASATWLVTRHFWLGAHAFGGFDLRPEEFYVTTPASPTPLILAMTPRAYVRASVDFGIYLGKN